MGQSESVTVKATFSHTGNLVLLNASLPEIPVIWRHHQSSENMVPIGLSIVIVGKRYNGIAHYYPRRKHAYIANSIDDNGTPMKLLQALTNADFKQGPTIELEFNGDGVIISRRVPEG